MALFTHQNVGMRALTPLQMLLQLSLQLKFSHFLILLFLFAFLLAFTRMCEDANLVLSTEPAFTHLEVSDCSQKVNTPEFPPVNICEVEFAVNGLPNQEVSEAC